MAQINTLITGRRRHHLAHRQIIRARITKDMLHRILRTSPLQGPLLWSTTGNKGSKIPVDRPLSGKDRTGGNSR
jgi:hypothetical protein